MSAIREAISIASVHGRPAHDLRRRALAELDELIAVEEAAFRYVDWHAAHIIPTAEIPDRAAALRALDAALDVLATRADSPDQPGETGF